MRVRGLKRKLRNLQHKLQRVAPHAGAWIETCAETNKKNKTNVAPHAGAWIETEILVTVAWQLKSHPMRVRGLKLLKTGLFSNLIVAPHAGAWIETILSDMVR